jgi:hypothetical protein
MAESVYHHGISVRDLAAWRTAVAAIGFTDVEGGGAPPRRFRNVEGDRVGQYIAGWLGEEIVTQIIDNPATGQQLDFVQIAPQSLRLRRTPAPLEGDTTIGVAVPDPEGALAALREAGPSLEISDVSPAPGDDGVAATVDGQRFIFTRGGPFTRVHYGAAWPRACRFYEDVLGYRVRPVNAPDGVERFAFEACGGRIEVEVDPNTAAPGEGDGKMYPGGNHFRLLDPRWEGVEQRLSASGLGSWLWRPNGGFAQVFGPCGESVELYDSATGGLAAPA